MTISMAPLLWALAAVPASRAFQCGAGRSGAGARATPAPTPAQRWQQPPQAVSAVPARQRRARSAAAIAAATAPSAFAARAGGIAMMVPLSPPTSVSKQALVDAIALKAGVSKKTAGLVLAATLDVIVDSVCEGHKVSLVGFGSFQSKERPEREARNPKTGDKMLISAATVPSFSFGKSFKDAVKQAGTARKS